MKLLEYFNQFLTDSVNLNQTRLGQLDERVDRITEALKTSVELKDKVVDTIPQGSWAHQTIIRPAPDTEFDADFLVQLEENDDWNTTPSRYADAVWAALSGHATYSSMTTRKNRCVRVTYSNDCHVDVIPYVVQRSGREVIVNRTTDEFEDTNPVGFTEWIQEKDDLTGGNLRRTLRLLKYLRDFQGAFDVRSVLLTTMVGNVVDQWRSYSDDYYKDVPTTLVHLAEDLDSWLQQNWTKPHVADPSCPATNFDHRWTENQYQAFRSKIHNLAPRLRAAYNLSGVAPSIAAWQSIFGSAFPAAVTAKALVASGSIGVARTNRAPQERFIEDMFRVNVSRQLVMKGEMQERSYPNRAAKRRYLRSRVGRITKGRSITFRVLLTDVPEPYEVYWKVRNFGVEAAARSQLRGEIVKGSLEHSESTAYAGHHYVECYIVKDGVCVARARERVDIPDVR